MFSPQIPDERMYELMLLDLGSYSDVLLNSTYIPSSRFSATTTDCPACINYKKAVITDPDSGEIVCSSCGTVILDKCKKTITNKNRILSVSKK
jgi:ribosomal protein S27E